MSKMNKEKITLLVQNIENLVGLLKLELGEQEEQKGNTISIKDLIDRTEENDSDIDYYEEDDDGPDVLLNNKQEKDFYANFKLGE